MWSFKHCHFPKLFVMLQAKIKIQINVDICSYITISYSEFLKYQEYKQNMAHVDTPSIYSIQFSITK